LYGYAGIKNLIRPKIPKRYRRIQVGTAKIVLAKVSRNNWCYGG